MSTQDKVQGYSWRTEPEISEVGFQDEQRTLFHFFGVKFQYELSYHYQYWRCRVKDTIVNDAIMLEKLFQRSSDLPPLVMKGTIHFVVSAPHAAVHLRKREGKLEGRPGLGLPDFFGGKKVGD